MKKQRIFIFLMFLYILSSYEVYPKENDKFIRFIFRYENEIYGSSILIKLLDTNNQVMGHISFKQDVKNSLIDTTKLFNLVNILNYQAKLKSWKDSTQIINFQGENLEFLKNDSIIINIEARIRFFKPDEKKYSLYLFNFNKKISITTDTNLIIINFLKKEGREYEIKNGDY